MTTTNDTPKKYKHHALRKGEHKPKPKPEPKPKREPKKIEIKPRRKYVRKNALTPDNVEKKAAALGYKVTLFITNEVWVDIYGNKYYIDRTPIRWNVINRCISK